MKNIKEMTLLSTPLSRRRFVKVGAAGGLVATAGGLSLPFSQAMASEQTAPTSTNKEKVVWSACTVNCGSRCPLMAKLSTLKQAIPAMTFTTSSIKYELAYVVALCVGVFIIQIAYVIP